MAASLLTAHTTVHTSTPAPQQQHPRRPLKVERPQLADNLTEVGWNSFLQDWETFVRANQIDNDDKAIQLFSCCDGELKGKVTSICPNVYTKTVDDLMAALKSLAVIPIASTVKINELLQMHQHAGELVRAYYSRVKGQASICNFRIKCTHAHTAQGDVYMDYTCKMIRHVLLNGLYDESIAREITSLANVEDLSNNELITRIEAKETARDAVNTSSAHAITEYRRQQRNQ